MPRVRSGNIVAVICLTAVAGGLGGCAQQLSSLTEAQDSGWFSKPIDLFRKPEWARLSNTSADLGPAGPVAPEELVSAEGQCAAVMADHAAAAAPAPAPTPASAPAGTGFEGGLQTGGPGSAPAATVTGGIALGMSECEAVRRAGTPSHVAISAGEGGARHVVLTYNSGPWPGIYTFDSGRLKVVDEAPVQEKRPAPTKKKPITRTKTAASAKPQ